MPYLSYFGTPQAFTRNAFNPETYQWEPVVSDPDLARSWVVIADDEKWNGKFPPFGSVVAVPSTGRQGKLIAEHVARLLNENPVPDSVFDEPY